MAHALLGASKASQWINCPPSARLQETVPEQSSEYAEEGTLAHELADIKLQRKLTICDSKKRDELDKRLDVVKQSSYYNTEMENNVNEYVEIVIERYMEAKARSSDAIVLLEEKLDFSEWVPEGYGTGDVVLIADGVLEVIDLKYGKGDAVFAENNPQIRLYALGAYSTYSWLYQIDEVKMTIIQPRKDNISTESMVIEDLLKWANDVVVDSAKLAFDGQGEFKCGDHCKWCKVKGNCKARADEQMKALSYEFQDPALLNNEEIGSILYIAEQLKAWAKDVEEYAQAQALKGEKIPQWKLVEGRSNRTINDTTTAISKFELAKIDSTNYLKPQDLFGITELEKRIGKKQLNELIGDLIIKPPGKPVLVPETDKRPELNSLEEDFANIDMED